MVACPVDSSSLWLLAQFLDASMMTSLAGTVPFLKFLSVYVDDIELAGKKQNMAPMWLYHTNDFRQNVIWVTQHSREDWVYSKTILRTPSQHQVAFCAFSEAIRLCQ